MIQCPCEIRFTPAGGSATVLVAEGGWMLDTPALEARQEVAEAQGVLNARGHIRALGGTRVDITLAIHEPRETGGEAMDSFLTGADALPAVSGSLAFVFAEDTVSYPALMIHITPGLPAWAEPETTREISFRASIPNIS